MSGTTSDKVSFGRIKGEGTFVPGRVYEQHSCAYLAAASLVELRTGCMGTGMLLRVLPTIVVGFSEILCL